MDDLGKNICNEEATKYKKIAEQKTPKLRFKIILSEINLMILL